ncbi:uncharacterized protein ACMZJ9_011673 [Mantella aurantiaca]
MAELSSSMAGLSGSMAGLSGSMAELSCSTAGLSGSMAGLSGKMAEISRSMATLSSKISKISASSPQTLEVYQIPSITAIEHSSVTLFCNYTFNGTFNGFYKWYRHDVSGPEVTNTSEGFSGRVSIVSQSDFIYRKSANLHIHQLVLSDYGLYVCEVTLITSPTDNAHGNSTFLEVKPFVAENSKTLIIVAFICSTIAVIAVLIFAAVVVFLRYHKTWSDCLFLRMKGDAEVHTYSSVEELRGHIDEQRIPQQINSTKNRIYIKENWQYGLPIAEESALDALTETRLGRRC